MNIAGVIPSVALVITTRDRCDLLRRTLTENLKQDHPNLQTWVMDDASGDGTAEMIASEFPRVRCWRAAEPMGYIRLRNLAAQMLVDHDLVYYTDDDSWLLTPDGIARAADVFRRCPGTVFVASEIFASYHPPLPPDSSKDEAETPLFVGCGFMIDRRRFLDLGGFDESFEFYGEEAEFALRVARSGMTGRFSSFAPVYHAITQSGRNRRRIIAYALANSLSSHLVHEPMPEALLHVAHSSLRSLGIAFKEGCVRGTVDGWMIWIRRLPDLIGRRNAISRPVWRRHRRLLREWQDYFAERESLNRQGRTPSV